MVVVLPWEMAIWSERARHFFCIFQCALYTQPSSRVRLPRRSAADDGWRWWWRGETPLFAIAGKTGISTFSSSRQSESERRTHFFVFYYFFSTAAAADIFNYQLITAKRSMELIHSANYYDLACEDQWSTVPLITITIPFVDTKFQFNWVTNSVSVTIYWSTKRYLGIFTIPIPILSGYQNISLLFWWKRDNFFFLEQHTRSCERTEAQTRTDLSCLAIQKLGRMTPRALVLVAHRQWRVALRGLPYFG